MGAPETVRYCAVQPVLGQYDVHVSWTRTATTTLSLRTEGSAYDVPLEKRPRKGQLTVRIGFIPASVVFLARDKVSGLAQCQFMSS